MTKAQFIHNCRGINEGENLLEEFLSEIYDRIILDEIRMMEDGALYPDATKKGWVTLRITRNGKAILKWKRSWFILLPQVLLYFKKPGDKEPAGKIELKDAKLVLKTQQDKKFCFCVHTPTSSTPGIRPIKGVKKSESETNFTSHDFSLPSERELISWTKIVKKAIDNILVAEFLKRPVTRSRSAST